MNPIDRKLLKSFKKVEFRLFPNSLIFEVLFASLPGKEALKPLLQLIETGRFEWGAWTSYELKTKRLEDLFKLTIEANNVIPVSAAIAALTEMWEAMGYEVSVVHPHGKAQNSAPKPFRASRSSLSEIVLAAETGVRSQEVLRDVLADASESDCINSEHKDLAPLGSCGQCLPCLAKRFVIRCVSLGFSL